MKSPQIYTFQNQRIRVAGSFENPIFCAVDVCDAMKIVYQLQTLSIFPEDEKDDQLVEVPGGKQTLTFLTESGVCRLIFGSFKPETESFRHWLFHDVLPKIRREDSRCAPGQNSVVKNRTVPLLSVRAFAAIHGWALLATDAKEKDQLAEALCRELGIGMGSTEDELFGMINTYPLEVLNETLGNEIAKETEL